MEIIIAPNAFKNSLKAEEVAEAIRQGFVASKLNCRCKCFPIADGGDGTAELIIGMQKGTTVSVNICDALRRSIEAKLGIIGGGDTVAQHAKRRGIPVIGMAGKLPVEHDDALGSSFDILIPIGNQPASLERAMRNTFINLVRTARMTGDTLAAGMSITT